MDMPFFTGLNCIVQVLKLNLRLRALLAVREVMLSRSTRCYYFIVSLQTYHREFQKRGKKLRK